MSVTYTSKPAAVVNALRAAPRQVWLAGLGAAYSRTAGGNG